MRAATQALAAELRLIRSIRLWLPAALLLAGATALLMPVNRAIGVGFYYGDAYSDQDYAHMLALAAPQMYTSGIFVGHLAAFLIGGLVVARDREYRRPKLVVAALAGVTLAVVQASVALPYAAARLRADPLAQHTTDPTLLGSAGIWRAILVSFLAYPLWAILGLGLGLIVRNRAGLVGVTLAAPVVLVSVIFMVSGTALGSFLMLLTPVLGVAALADDRAGPYMAGLLVCVLAGFAALAHLLAARVTRRRTATAATEPSGSPMPGQASLDHDHL